MNAVMQSIERIKLERRIYNVTHKETSKNTNQVIKEVKKLF